MYALIVGPFCGVFSQLKKDEIPFMRSQILTNQLREGIICKVVQVYNNIDSDKEVFL